MSDVNFLRQSGFLIPENLVENKLYIKIQEMLDYIIEVESENFKDVINKYRDPSSITKQAAETSAIEYGYGYIVNILSDLSEEEVGALLGYISLIHTLKGTRSGLELVLTLLGFDFELEEWWEAIPPKEADTFKMVILLNFSVNNQDEYISIITRLRTFIKKYVYPLLTELWQVYEAELAVGNTFVAGFNDKIYPGLITN